MSDEREGGRCGARSVAVTLLAAVVTTAVIAYGRTFFGAEVGEPCSDFLLSCRATRGIFTLNVCTHRGVGGDETYCSYECREDAECPAGWTCAEAGAWSNVPGAAADVHRVCAR